MSRQLAALALVVTGLTVSRDAAADRYEATLVVRPLGGLALVDENGAPEAAQVVGGGGVIGMSYGVRNWLDIGGELVGVGLAQAEHPNTTVEITGTERTGLVTRTTRVAQLRGGATFRFGVGWVPTVYLGVGVGGRSRGTATLVSDMQGPIGITPDDGASELTIDITPAARVGLEHRVNRHWSVGLAAGATYCLGIGAPGLTLFDASLNLAYTWYPLW